MSVTENRMIDRLLATTGPAPLDRRRTYLDPEGGFLRAAPGSRTADKVKAMAGAMALHAAGDGACTIEHLRAAGFSAQEIELYRDAAVLLARSDTPAGSASARGSARLASGAA